MGRRNTALVILIACMIVVLCGCGKDYRKDIEKKGIPFTEEAFLKEVSSGNREHVELFAKAGMNINAKDKDGSTALMIAAEKGDLPIAQLLIEHGADVNANNADGYTALMYVAYKGNLAVAELLIKSRADINAQDKDGWTALRYASVQGKKEMVALLKKAKDKK
jgi:ankyrin repeat protein